jgi:biopolymer transport protein ExbB
MTQTPPPNLRSQPLLLLCLLCLAAPASAQTLSVFDQLRNAGISIYAIGALSVLALAVALERFTRFRAQRLAPAQLVPQLLPLWQAGDFEGAQQLLHKDGSLLAQVLGFVLQHRALGASALATRAGEMASLALRQQQQRAYPLAVVATVAPIIGLLGTVVGMIEAFHVIAYSGGLGDPALLAGGISKALVNTAAGLSVALPALALHHFFKHRLTTVGLAMETQINRVIDEVLLHSEVHHAH